MERELLFPVGEHQWSRTTSPRLLASLLKTSIEGVQKGLFLDHPGKSQSRQTKAHACQSGRGRQEERVGSLGRGGDLPATEDPLKSGHKRASFRI